MTEQSYIVSFDVIVIGFGPVGAALAALLGRYGVNTLVVEKAKSIRNAPHATALDNEALRVLQMVGIDREAFEQVIIPEVKMVCPHLGQLARVNTNGFIDTYPKLVTFYQPDLEQVLRTQVSLYSCVKVICEAEMASLNQNADGVTVEVVGDKDKKQVFFGRYLVGADGANSTVRSLIKQTFKGRTFVEDWLVIDVVNRPAPVSSKVNFLSDQDRPASNKSASGGRERWEFRLKKGESKAYMETKEKGKELLAPFMDGDAIEIERQSVYRLHARCCHRFQKDKVFLVGDAAHITPPFVGQSLIIGLRDAGNLAWKLAAVAQGRASENILKSYDIERRPYTLKMINLVRLMSSVVMPSNWLTAMIIRGFISCIQWLFPFKNIVEALFAKPENQFKNGLFNKRTPKTNVNEVKPFKNKLIVGGKIPQDYVRKNGVVFGSDEMLGDDLTLVGFGIDPLDCMDAFHRAKWEANNGEYLCVGTSNYLNADRDVVEKNYFVELIGNELAFYPTSGWLAVIRPDRVIMGQSSPSKANMLVSDCLALLES